MALHDPALKPLQPATVRTCWTCLSTATQSGDHFGDYVPLCDRCANLPVVDRAKVAA